IERYFGEIPPQLELRIGDVEPVVAEIAPERLILDLPEPWHAVAPAAEHQPPGGIFCGYLPTVPQVQTLVDALRATRAYAEIEVKEFLFRDWNVSGRSVRPEHTMVGHTGFLVFARRTERREARPAAPGQGALDSAGNAVDMPQPAGPGGGRGPVRRPALVQGVDGVALPRVHGVAQVGGDLAVGAAGRHRCQPLQL